MTEESSSQTYSDSELSSSPSFKTSETEFKMRDIDYNQIARHYSGMNRYVVLGLYCIPVIMSSSIYYNWSSLSRLLVRGHVYEWHCTPEEIAETATDLIKCERQFLKLSNLLVLTRSLDMACSALTGFIVDRYTQRYVMVTGACSFFFAWLCLGFSEKKDMLIILAFILFAISASCVFMSTLNVVNLFGNNRALLICFTISFADDVSTFIPLSLNGLLTLVNPKSVHSFFLYMSLSAIPIILIAFFVMPNKSWNYYIKNYTGYMKTQTFSHQGTAVRSYEMMGSDASLEDQTVAFKPITSEQVVDGNTFVIAIKQDTYSTQSSDDGKLSPKSMEVNERREITRRLTMLASCSELETFSCSTHIKQVLRPSLKHLFTSRFLMIVTCFTITNFTSIFLSNLIIKMYEGKGKVLFTSEVLLSATFVPGFLVGLLFDYSVKYVNLGLCVLSFFAFGFTFSGNLILGYVTALLHTIITSVDVTTLIVYVNLVFPIEFISTMTGFAFSLDGLVSLCLMPLDTFMLETESNFPMYFIFILLTLKVSLIMYLHLIIDHPEELKRRGPRKGLSQIVNMTSLRSLSSYKL